MARRFRVLGLLFFLLSCEKKTETGSESQIATDYQKYIVDSLIIPIDNYTSYKMQYTQYWESKTDDQRIYSVHNRKNNQIQLYDIDKRKLIKSYNIPTDGKYGLGSYTRGFYLKNLDSVFLMASRPFKVLLINYKSEVVSSYRIFSDSVSSQPTAYTRKPMYMKGKSLYVGANPRVQFDGDYWSHPLFLKLDISSKQFEYYYYAPQEFIGKMWGAFHNHHSYTINSRDEAVHSFTFDKKLYVRDIDKNNVKKEVVAASRYFKDVPPWKTEGYDPNDDGDEEFYITNNSYKSILWDKWRRVYYRFAEQGVSLYDNNGFRRNWTDKRPSIIVLDEDFSIIKEIQLPRSIYLITDVFAAEEGLYISANNDSNPGLKEDFFTFHVFQLTTP